MIYFMSVCQCASAGASDVPQSSYVQLDVTTRANVVERCEYEELNVAAKLPSQQVDLTYENWPPARDNNINSSRSTNNLKSRLKEHSVRSVSQSTDL
jgi:hypothetical protein